MTDYAPRLLPERYILYGLGDESSGKTAFDFIQVLFHSRIHNNESSEPYPHVIDKFSVYDHSTYAVVPCVSALSRRNVMTYASWELYYHRGVPYIPGTGIINRHNKP